MKAQPLLDDGFEDEGAALLLHYYSQGYCSVIQKSMSLEYELASEPMHISVCSYSSTMGLRMRAQLLVIPASSSCQPTRRSDYNKSNRE